MARSTSWPFLTANEVIAHNDALSDKTLAIKMFDHQTNIDGDVVPTKAPLAESLDEVLTICKGDELLAVRVFNEGFKLRINAHVRGPLLKELKERKEQEQKLSLRRTFTKVWMRENDRATYDAHADNGIDEVADKVFADKWKEIRKAFPVCP